MVKKTSSQDEKLQKLLLHKTKPLWDSLDEKKIFSFSEKYKKFLSVAKTERLCFHEVVSQLSKVGFKDASKLKSVKSGDKVFFTFKNKTVFAVVVGKDKSKLRLLGSHMDSPRLDLKPNPLVQDSDFALLKTHYYGGVKKYQWVNTPLSLTGVVMLSSEKKVVISIGEKDSDPKFLIPDLLPHLSQQQMERKGNKIIQGEELQVLVGSIPLKKSTYSEKIKLAILKVLYDKYKITEKDFVSAELQFVPSVKPFDVGFDKSLIGAYSHDDHVCVFSTLQAIIDVKNPTLTAAALFVDKEEIGSVGNTGAASFLPRNFAAMYVKLANLSISVDEFLQSALAVSADVGAGINPIFKDVHDITNAPHLGRGPIIYKYKGAGGKSYTDDASAEYVSFIRSIFDDAKLPWQSAEGGKIDLGGGGTIAMYLSRYGMDIIDVGPAVLAMHSPCEVVSKADVYSCYLFYRAFLEK